MRFATPPSAAGNVGVSEESMAAALTQRNGMDTGRCEYCTGCTSCLDCRDCHMCVRCIGGRGLGYCTGCSHCSDCTRCVECDRCTGCIRCEDCIDLTYRTDYINNLSH